MDEDEGYFPEYKGSDAPGGKDEVDPPPSFKRKRITDHQEGTDSDDWADLKPS